MDKFLQVFGMPKLWTVVISTLLAVLTPITGFIVAMLMTGFFNIWCGMRADGVTNFSCVTFSWKKFRYALLEVVLFMTIMYLIGLLCHLMGEPDMVIYSCKIVGIIFCVCSLENGFKNLCKVYPRSKPLWLIYLFIRLDFRRILNIEELMAKYERHLERQENGNYKVTTEGDNA